MKHITECKCTFAQKMVGDGCMWCNPTMQFEIYEEEINELESKITTLTEAL